ncbi:MAG: hypothetical protein IJE09_04185 [Oscillospiraceae bacterium]|nr:hypothetical protein [Oscillospiraceae bacterium]
MSKKKTLLLIAIIICLCFAVGGTLAYFSGSETAHNVITTGNVSIVLKEQARTENGLDDFTNPTGIMPGAEVSKIVTVENDGAAAAWIRVKVAKSVVLAEGKEGEIDLSLITLDINTEDWTEQDGYYYYNDPVLPYTATEPLFTTVSFDVGMGNLYQNSEAHIDVVAEAVQVANNGTSALDANGWPKKLEA